MSGKVPRGVAEVSVRQAAELHAEVVALRKRIAALVEGIELEDAILLAVDAGVVHPYDLQDLLASRGRGKVHAELLRLCDDGPLTLMMDRTLGRWTAGRR